MDLSVVIPVYGCPEALPVLYDLLVSVIKNITHDYEIIFVNDACPKNSWNEIEQLCQDDSKVIGINLTRNFGQMKAILAGMEYSSGKWLIVMDCDLQDSPQEILRLYRKLQEGYDVVFTRRIERKDPLLKRVVSNLFYKIYSFATDDNYDPSVANYCIMTREVADAYCSMRETHRSFVMYIKWLGYSCGYIEVDHQSRHSGSSSYTLKKRLNYAGEILTSQSDKLLKLIAKTGFIISFISFIMVIITVVRYFILHIPQGYTSLVAVIFLLGGFILTAIGIVGIYIGNIFMEVKHRPLYIVKTILNDNKTKADHEESRESI